MASEPRRDPTTDHLLTPENAAIVIIDYQPPQVFSITSMDRHTLISNIVCVAKIGRVFDMPIVHSTVNVTTGMNKPPIPQLRAVLRDLPTVDRTSINAWEDVEFVAAVKATGRKKLIMAALWTEACLTFPALDALLAGYEVYAVTDAVGGTSLEAHRSGLRRIEQAGARMTSVTQLVTELQRDWARRETLGGLLEAFGEVNGLFPIVSELLS